MLRPVLGAAIAALAMLPAANAAASAVPTPTPTPKPYNYAVIGDIPYSSNAVNSLAAFPSHIQQINNDASIHLVLHLGDIKSGSTRCDTTYFEQIKADFDLSTRPFIYTPGDNEWTDCHRANNGGYLPAGPAVPASQLAPAGPVVNGAAAGKAGNAVPSRLSEIRRIFYPTPTSTLGQRTRRLAAQTPNYPENVRWTEISHQITGAMLNVPGSNNDLVPWYGAAETPLLVAQQNTEYTKRNAANLRMLDRVFDKAVADNSKAVLIGIQADMWDPAIFTPASPQYSGFRDFVQLLAARTIAFGKPVLLLNGDSHVYEADNPLADHTAFNSTVYGVTQDVPNLKRVTVDGSGTANDYLRLTIDPSSADVFSWSRVNWS
jgi:hypothetical protein